MKINSFIPSLGYSPVVREKQDGQSPSEDQSSSSQGGESQTPSDDQEANSNDVDQAVSAFQADLQNQTNGLSAVVVGTGPGLRVVLKDGTGSILRQLTGGEFLRLRQAGPQDGKIRGKILDQKL